MDRELYLPKEWASDVDRRAEVHVPAKVGFATKPQLAQAMLARALDAGMPAGWVTADEVYGGDARLRAFMEDHDLAYVLAVKATQPLWAASAQGPAELPAHQLVAGLPARAWRRLSAGDGAKGPRVYDWARVALTRPGWPGRGFWLLARRRLSDGELAFYACFGPTRTTLAELVRWRGSAGRWRCVNHSALIYANWLHDLGSHPGLVALSRPSGGGCTSQAGGIGAGGARRAGRCRRG